MIRDYPPMFDLIDQTFLVRGQKVIYCWGDKIYNPMNVEVGPHLHLHEAVHSAQQGGNPEAWWIKYCEDRQFRLEQEIPAHIAEFKYFSSQPHADDPMPGFRSKREYWRLRIAQKLSHPVYGGIITTSKAKHILANA